MRHPRVTIEQGQLEGTLNTDYKGGKYYSFKGIPYGKLPDDDYRFKTAIPAGPWIGIWDATVEKDVCFQKNIFQKGFTGSEHCLYLNVYTKTLLDGHHDTLKPVMVYIHGGTFTHGSGNSDHYGPEFLMTEDIVLVTINYRLGILGFLSFDDENLEIPGNAGLRDMILALQWVQNNITEFSGDAANVTIFGESAGAASVHYLMLSSLAEGLFHKCILQSGCALNYWALGKQITEELCKKFHAHNSHELLRMLKGMPLEKLYEIQVELEEGCLDACNQRYLAPVIENTHLEPPVINKHPLDIIKSGKYNKVPILMGYNSFEGLLSKLHEEACNSFKEVESNIPYSLNINRDSEEMNFLVREIEKFYFNGKNILKADKKDIYKLCSDTMFVVDILEALTHHLKSSNQPIYLYKCSLDTALNYLKKKANIDIPGCCHADDLGYLFKTQVTPKEITKNSIEDISIQRFVKLWTNFARYGNPTPDDSLGLIWPPTKSNTLEYLEIGEELEIKQNIDHDVRSLWSSFLKMKNYL